VPKLRYKRFDDIPDHLKRKLIALNKWPIPDPTPDQVVTAFLRQFDVDAQPSQTPGFDGWDLLLGFTTNFEYAQLNSINRNQAKQSKYQEWTSWKQWALANPDYQPFKASFLQAIQEENLRRLKWLLSPSGEKTIEELEEAKVYEDKALSQLGMLITVVCLAISVTPLLWMSMNSMLQGVGTGFATLISLPFELINSISPQKSPPEPTGINHERYMWLSGKCFQKQSGQSSRPSGDNRNYCKEMDSIIQLLVNNETNGGEASSVASRDNDLVDKCKSYISGIMGQPTSIMDSSPGGSEADDIARISYRRPADGKIFKYECRLDGNSIIWRGVDIFAQGEGPGRWRHEDAKPISEISVE